MLKGFVQHYSWGEVGARSLVAQMHGESIQQKPYAELWFGSHASGPCVVVKPDGTEDLRRIIEANPEAILGTRFSESREMPFLFKVLSVRQPLSIQVHPDKASAERLKKAAPELYPDSNEKLEIALAVSEVHLLYGFRGESEVQRHLKQVPEFAALVGRLDEGSAEEGTLLRKVVHAMLRADEATVQEQSRKLFSRILQAGARSPEEEWILRLESQYPQGDIGLFFFFLLGLQTLKPEQAVFIRPGVPHSYLSGDLLECITCSDNVARAGLTAKPRDGNNLLSLLDFGPHEFAPTAFSASPESALSDSLHILSFAGAPFVINRLTSAQGKFKVPRNSEVSMLFSLTGFAKLSCADFELKLQPGSAALLPAAMSEGILEIEKGQIFQVVTS